MGLLCSVRIPYKSGQAEDQMVNNWVVGGIGGAIDAGGMTALSQIITSFYNEAWTSRAVRLADVLSPCLDRGADQCSIAFYNISGALDGSPHGSPVGIRTWTLLGGGSLTPLPEECATVLTLEAAGRANQRVEAADGVDVGALLDRPRQRYTGRLYLGPFADDPVVTHIDANDNAKIDAGFITDVLAKYAEVADDVETVMAGGWLGVWSRSDSAIRSIDNVSMDNAWDTQRRRGTDATTRTRTAVAVAVNVELAA